MTQDQLLRKDSKKFLIRISILRRRIIGKMLIKDLLPKKHLETPFEKDLLVKKDVGNI